MIETELKFQVPPASRKAVRRAVATPSATETRLRAKYFDTPERRLANAGVALRLRMEGTHWVQTVKAGGASALHRLEHEVPVEAAGTETPPLDLTRHAGTPAGRALEQALGGDSGALQVVYETDVLRTHRSVRSTGALVELAFDEGEVVAGTRRLPLCEIEFELKRGPVQGLLALAGHWAQRHHLWLDVRSKAERGDRLARGVDAGPVVQALGPRLDESMSSDAALRAIVGSCLAQVLPNAADVAAGVGGAEHLHQLRVGLRRLRSALRVFADWSAATDPAWMPALAKVFSQLGTTRDRDVLIQTVLPELQRAGAPLAGLPPDPTAEDPGEAVRGAVCTPLLLKLIAFAEGVAAPEADQPRVSVTESALMRIRRLRRRLTSDAKRFPHLDDVARHRARKRLKRLRYSLEFAGSLASVKRCLGKVRVAQEVLGRYNDLSVAEQVYRGQTEQDPRAWFAVGWLAAQRAELTLEATSALQALANAPKLRRKRR